MKFLFLTVALVHCALAASEQKQEEPHPEDGALDGVAPEHSETFKRYQRLYPGVTNPAALMRIMRENPLPEATDLTANLRDDMAKGLDSHDGVWWDQEIKLVFKSDIEGESAEFVLSRTDACKMHFLKQTLMGDDTAVEFPLEKDMVQSSDALQFCVDYVTGLGDRKPKDIQKPIRSVNIVECIADEDRADAENMLALFADGEGKRAVFDVILAANYLDIKSLLHLGCVQIATQIKGKSPAEIRAILGDDLNEDLQDDVEAMNGRRRLLAAMSKAL